MSVMSQACFYGGLTFPFQTVKAGCTNVYADNGTLVYSEWDLTISGVVTADQTFTTLAEAVNEMRWQLNTPRQVLKLSFTPSGGSAHVLFAFGDETSTAGRHGENILDPDIEWGPLPQTLNIQSISGGLAAEYEWRVKCRTKEMLTSDIDRNNQGRSRILSISRSYVFDIDQDGFTTRTITGKVVVDRQSIAFKQGVSYYRTIVNPPVPNGFHRERQTWAVDTTGLSGDFTIVDKEKCYVLPQFITSGEARLTTTTPRLGGRVQFTLSGRFGAPKTVSKTTILNAIGSLLRQKMTTASILESREISADLYGDNSIAFRVQWWEVRIVPTGGQVSQQALAGLTSAPLSNGTVAAVAGPYGSAGLTENLVTDPYDAGVNRLSTLPKQLAGRQSKLPDSQTTQATTPPIAAFPEPGQDVSQLALKNPIIDINWCRSYEVKTHRKVFRPKVPQSAVVIQQTAPADIWVIDAGVMRFVSDGNPEKMPAIPSPPNDRIYEVLESFVEPAAPDPIGDGMFNAYKISWRYVCIRKTAITGKSFDSVIVQVPPDLRRQSSKEITLTQKLDGILPPVR